MILPFNQRLTPEELSVDETNLTTQNGYLGVRACFEEGVPYQQSHRGTYMNGIYDSKTIHYGESAHGFPELSETMVNLPDTQLIKVTLGNESLDLTESKILELKRAFDLDKGITTRSVLYETKSGFQCWIHTKRMAHLEYLPLFMIDFEIESVNYEGPCLIESCLDANINNLSDKDDIRLSHQDSKHLNLKQVEILNDIGKVRMQTLKTNIEVSVLMHHSHSFELAKQESLIKATKMVRLNKQMKYQFQKKSIYLNSLDHPNLNQTELEWMAFLKETPLDELYLKQQKTIKQIKPRLNLNITSKDSDLNESIQYALYQLYTSGAANERVNIPAKGLTGEGYEGHMFWDTEIYMLPFYMQVSQSKARSLLLNRYHQLEHAKQEALLLGVNEGVKFAWRTITGKETSAYYPASTAQYHINSDIAYAVIQYHKLYQDDAFMHEYGFKILLETARFFKTVLHDYEGAYHMHHVTGPDEYNAVVDDNYYTNAMLKYHLTYLIEWIEENDISFNSEELDIFKDIKNRIYLKFDEALNIDVQDASFLSKKPFNYKDLKDSKKPMLLHFHPLTIYRHQILKQADTILSHLLLFNRPIDVMRDSMAYYEPKTTHDSSLSYCVHSAQYAKLGDIEKAYEYFIKTLRLDLDNTHKNTFHGLHVANLGGIYFSLLNGFIGYEIKDFIHIHPRLPKAWESVEITCQLIGTGSLNILINHQSVTLTSSKDTTVVVHGANVSLGAHEQKELSNIWF